MRDRDSRLDPPSTAFVMPSDRHSAPLGALLLCVLALAVPATMGAQHVPSAGTLRLSLEEATKRALATSDALYIARAESDRADGERRRAAGSRLPRLAAHSTVDRALRTEFDGLALGAGPSGDEPALPFGSPTTYRAGLTLSQPLLTGGRIAAATRAAGSGARAAALAHAAARAQVTLETAIAYHDALLAEQLTNIVVGTLEQAEQALARAALLHQAGRGSEFELLRARVARDRQRPVVLRQQGDRDAAMLRLRQLLDLDPGVELQLTDSLVPAPGTASARPPARETGRFAAVREARERLRAHESLLDATLAERWPTLSLVSSYERVAYGRDELPVRRDFRTNWTLGARVELPLLTAGRRPGDEAQRRADAAIARASVRAAEKGAVFTSRESTTRLAVAEAAWAAGEGAVREAERAHEIARLRHAEGLAIQLELSDARLALESARAERARAGRDLIVERVRSALLPELPAATLRDR